MVAGLGIFGIVIVSFIVDEKSWCFEKTLLADINMNIASGMLFLTWNNVKINIIDPKLSWSSYSTTKALSTNKRVKLFWKKEFLILTLNLDDKIFVLHKTSLTSSDLDVKVYSSCKAKTISLKADDGFISVSSKYADFVEVFFKDLTAKLLEHTRINNHTIKGQQLWKQEYKSS